MSNELDLYVRATGTLLRLHGQKETHDGKKTSSAGNLATDLTVVLVVVLKLTDLNAG